MKNIVDIIERTLLKGFEAFFSNFLAAIFDRTGIEDKHCLMGCCCAVGCR